MQERRFDVFLSYNSADLPAVERIAERLRRERLEPWWDRWALVPGGNWLLPGAPELDDPSLAFLRSRTWVDLRAGVGDAEGIQNLVSAVTGVPRRHDVTVADPGTSPYRGLAAVEEERGSCRSRSR